MRSFSGLTVALFGVTALISGAGTLLQPSQLLSHMSISTTPSTTALANGLGLASFAMGLYYLLAAYQNNRAFFVASVPMRLLTTAVFWTQGGNWRQVALWEGAGAVGTAFALGWEVYLRGK